MSTTVTLKPNAIDLSGSTSGTTTLQATAVAGTTTVTLPAATDTLVGKATTDTLTNKTLTAPTLASANIITALTLTGASGTNGQVLTSAGTGAAPTWSSPSTTSISNGTSNVTVNSSGGTITAATNGTTAITIDTAQNVGLKTTPSAWNTFTSSLQIDGSSLSGLGANNTALASNAYYNSAWKYYGTGSATLYQQNSGLHTWQYAGSGTAGNNITFVEAMRITSSGYLKASDNGSYLSSGGAYSEVNNSNASNPGFGIGVSNASYVSDGIFMSFSSRSSSSTFNAMQVFTSGGNTLYKFRGDGNAYADGTFNNNGADYAEYFESANGQALTVGTTVVLDGNKIREATSQDDVKNIIGVVRPKEPSKASMIVGNTAWNKWANQYLSDDFDRYIMEDHDVVEWTDSEGKTHTYESQSIPSGVTVPSDATRKTHDENGVKFQHYKVNPQWNPDTEYVNRENRPEWNIIGLLGQVKLLKGKPVGDRWTKMRDVSSVVEEWFIR
jgi:hypothetical protein